jgi:hypothetical protein
MYLDEAQGNFGIVVTRLALEASLLGMGDADSIAISGPDREKYNRLDVTCDNFTRISPDATYKLRTVIVDRAFLEDVVSFYELKRLSSLIEDLTPSNTNSTALRQAVQNAYTSIQSVLRESD